MFKKGDLIKNRAGTLAEVTRGGYTYRFMEAEDYEMESHGMGEYAGIYATAYDVTYLSGPRQGRTTRIRGGHGGWTRVTSGEVSVG